MKNQLAMKPHLLRGRNFLRSHGGTLAFTLLSGFLILAAIKANDLIKEMFVELVTPGSTGLADPEFYSLREERLIWLIACMLLSTGILFFARKTRGANLTVLLWSIYVLYTGTETVLMYCPIPDSVGTTFGHALYVRKSGVANCYVFTSERGLGFVQLRQNPFPADICQKTRFLFVGASFTYGDGVNNDETFPAVFADGYPGIAAVNLGVRGLDLGGQYSVLEEYRIRMARLGCDNYRRLFWQLSFSDIAHFANPANYASSGEEPEPPGKVETFFEPYANVSLTLNALYWWTVRHREAQDHRYEKFLNAAFRDPEAVARMIAPVVQASKNLPVTVIMFPILTADPGDESMYEESYRQLQSNHIDCIRVGKLIKDLPRRDRVVSYINPHPSKKVCRIVGKFLKKEYLLP